MPATVLIGAQWGDEGKGKIVDFLTERADVVVRFQGGNNAGHTIEIGKERYVLHLVPSGILRAGTLCVIANGLVVDPVALVEEIRELEARGVTVRGRLLVSDRAHLVFPYHRRMDAAREGASANGQKIGTTQRGIGPAYADKANRLGLRMVDLLAPDLPERLARRVEEKNRLLAAAGADPVAAAELLAQVRAAAAVLAPYIADTATVLARAAREGKAILLEGAQGTMLDIDFGTYPFVTSSSAAAGGACTGTGLPPRAITRVIGVLKAYTTRVGEGPFPTELTDETGEYLRRQGREFGATTGRPRRCGWFDAVVARYTAAVNGIDEWALTKLDVLDGVPLLRVCVAYEVDGRRLDTVPADAQVLARCRPVYVDIPGWQGATTTGVTRFEDLPPAARHYVDQVRTLTGVPVGILSIGPRRESTFCMEGGCAGR